MVLVARQPCKHYIVHLLNQDSARASVQPVVSNWMNLTLNIIHSATHRSVTFSSLLIVLQGKAMRYSTMPDISCNTLFFSFPSITLCLSHFTSYRVVSVSCYAILGLLCITFELLNRDSILRTNSTMRGAGALRHCCISTSDAIIILLTFVLPAPAFFLYAIK